MNIQIIQVPYDSGHRSVRMGSGPEQFISCGLDQALAEAGHTVHVECIESSQPLPLEIGTTFELNRLLAGCVRTVVEHGHFPLILAGNCDTCVGTLAGLGPEPVGIIWFDAHGDFNTPETTITGFLDGMGLAIATGRCWRLLADAIPGFQPVPEAHVALAGGRDFDPEELKALEQSAITLVPAGQIRQAGVRQALVPALMALQRYVQRVYLHIDMDVLDPAELPANQLAPPDGLTAEQVADAIRLIQEQFTISAAALTAYDADYDHFGNTARAGIGFAQMIAGSASSA